MSVWISSLHIFLNITFCCILVKLHMIIFIFIEPWISGFLVLALSAKPFSSKSVFLSQYLQKSNSENLIEPPEENTLEKYLPLLRYHWIMQGPKKREGNFNGPSYIPNCNYCLLFKGAWDKPFIRVAYGDEQPIHVQRRSGYEKLVRVL